MSRITDSGVNCRSVPKKPQTPLDDEPVNSGGIHEKNAYRLFHYMPMLSTTTNNTNWYYTPDIPGNNGFGQQIQNGRGDLYESFYDIMDRIATMGPNNGWTYLMKILHRFAQPDRLSGGAPLSDGTTPQTSTPGAVGVSVPFPEAALPATSFLYGFLGINARVDGLTVQPNLPSSLHYAGVRNLYYDGHYFGINEVGRRVTLTISPHPIPTSRSTLSQATYVRWAGTAPAGKAIVITNVRRLHPRITWIASRAFGPNVLP